MLRTRGFAWHKEFSGGYEKVEKQGHNYQPMTNETEANIKAVRTLRIENARYVTNWAIGSIQQITTMDLGFHKVSARCIHVDRIPCVF
ncbi:hypothetical protein Trydic_g532 [Trypoxylus dichotomus]